MNNRCVCATGFYGRVCQLGKQVSCGINGEFCRILFLLSKMSVLSYFCIRIKKKMLRVIVSMFYDWKRKSYTLRML